jgi:A/G-specific adenine glycosylase
MPPPIPADDASGTAPKAVAERLGGGLEPFRARVLEWFARSGRDLPWRSTRDPYQVLVAEVLAQQTQAGRAAAGYARFLERFPDTDALAAATPAEVLRAWQGMGYNRRALALRGAARAVRERGAWPPSVAELQRLPGVGPYTARAVACFAYGQPVAPVDTNVARVLARALLGRDPAQLTPAARQRLADAALPAERAWAWSSAVMDVGAAFCRPRPRCDDCPAAAGCAWRALGAAAPPPIRRPQAPFATSDRRWRGAVVRALAAVPDGLPEPVLAEAVDAAGAGRPEGWFSELLDRMAAEGLVERTGGSAVRLPGAEPSVDG